ncbi:hypothetical protein FERRO_10850 [Ferrovum sp. JA12]|uniref:relaxase/mobilization nuclease domain-containing protein n=1 Tax=Ferrovum sp. JA12 TaxID=1356299 RepID=UPI0007027BF4|nr:hypothetical protein [Ferrovum sp. JA12]KRH78105.1 hypothetical protein FERRO_10850 [Ferrovum sp. JA12]
MSRINLWILSGESLNTHYSFENILLYLTRDYYEDDKWAISQGLMGINTLDFPLYQKSDLLSLAQVLRRSYLLSDKPFTLHHAVLSWQASTVSYYSIKQEINSFLARHPHSYQEALWFIHTDTNHPHVHLLLISKTAELALKKQLKKEILQYNQKDTNVRNVSQTPFHSELLHTQPLSFYQWIRFYLKKNLMKVIEEEGSQWRSLLQTLNFCQISIHPRHQSFVWSTQLNGRPIYIKPSVIDKQLSATSLIKKWGPVTPDNSINRQSLVSYQQYYSLFSPKKIADLNATQHSFNHYSLLQLQQNYLYSTTTTISLIQRKSKDVVKQQSIIEQLHRDFLLTEKEVKQLHQLLHNRPNTLKALRNKVIKKKPSWTQFLINETYLNNTLAKQLLHHMWQSQLKQTQRLSEYVNSVHAVAVRQLAHVNHNFTHDISVTDNTKNKSINR